MPGIMRYATGPAIWLLRWACIALMSGFAAELIDFIPGRLLTAVVGLAVLGILAQSLQAITKGPLFLGPLVAFGTSVSDVQMVGLGRFFWALVFGLAVSLLLERSQWRQIHRTSEVPA